MRNRRKIELFVSYARSNKNLTKNFLDRFEEYVAPSKSYEYVFWQDERILVGEEWHQGIREALERCGLGLLLVSPAFLGSKYISKHELPEFVGNASKPLIPIMLQPIDFDRFDLKGLKRRQIFRLDSEKFKSPKSYGECIGNQRYRFVQALFGKVEQRL
ncbi:MAG: toll/interleukin-1 receptor domain-containing protein, partial [Planctomycetota bacterium]